MLEWTMLSYYVIYYEKFRKIMQRTEKEALSTDTYIKLQISSTVYWLCDYIGS